MSISILMSKMFFLIKHLPIARPQLVPKWKMFRIYWNLAKLIFQICQSQLWCQKWYLLNIYHLLGPNWSKIKSIENLTHLVFLLYRTQFNVKIIFIKYWPIARSEFVPELKVLRIYWNLTHLVFLLCRSQFNVKIIFIKYWPIARSEFVLELKVLRIYWNLA